MPNVLPTLGSYGYVYTVSFERIVHSYADNTYRSYAKSIAEHGQFDMPFSSFSKTKRDLILAFFRANWNLEFYIYTPPDATAVDLTGAATTGRHLARFGSDPSLAITNESSCAYSGNLTIILLS